MSVAVLIYIYLFYVYHDNEIYGVMERSKETKIFYIFFVYTIFFFLFCSSNFIQQIKPVWLRSALLLGCTIIGMVCVLPAWRFNKYDHEKISSYIRLFPFKNSPYIKYREALFFNEIKAVKYDSGGDSGSGLRLILGNGKRQDLEIGSIPNKSMNIFLVTLYEKCNWLQNNIEDEFGSIEQKKIYINKKIENRGFNIVHVIFFVFFIWVILIDITGLIIYTFKKS
jgi:hypothetical protein